MADKQLWEVIPVANDVKNDDGVIIGGQTAGTRYAPLTLIANYVHNLWATFINAITPLKTSFASGDKFPLVNGSTATAIEADKLLELTSQNALAGFAKFTDNDKVSPIIKELYIPAFTDAYIQSITKCRIYNGYNGEYGIKFFDSSNAEKLALMANSKQALIKSAYNDSCVVLNYDNMSSQYEDYTLSVELDFVRDVNYSPAVSAYLKYFAENANIDAKTANIYLTNPELNKYIKELYIPALTDAQASSIVKVRIQAGYAGLYGIVLLDSSNNSVIAIRGSVRQNYISGSDGCIVLDYRELNTSEHLFDCTINKGAVKDISFSPFIALQGFAKPKFTDNEILNSALKELYIPAFTDAYIQSITKCRIYNGHNGEYGIKFFDSSNAEKLALTATSKKELLKSAYNNSSVVLNYSSVSSTYADYACSIVLDSVRAIDYNPAISAYLKELSLTSIIANKTASPFVTSPDLSSIINELYIPSSVADSTINNVVEIRVQNGYAGLYGITLRDSGGNTLVAIRESNRKFFYENLSSSTKGCTCVVDWTKSGVSNNQYKDFATSVNLANVRDLAQNPYTKSIILERDLHNTDYFDSSVAIPSYSALNSQRPVVYRGDTKSNSNFVVNAVAYPDGSFIACRQGGSVVKIATDGTETTLLTISGASDWRLCYMDSALNVYVSPHDSIGNGGNHVAVADRGLYKLTYGESTFVKVIALYNPASSVPTEAEVNDDTIWTMCEDADGNLYAGVYAHTTHQNPAIYKSTDGGDTWTYLYNFVTSGLTPSGRHIHEIIYNEFDRNLYCIVGEVNNIYKSTDGGTTWSATDYVLEAYKGTALIAVKDGLVVGSDGGYECIMSKVYANGLVKTNGKMWANIIFAIRRSDVSGKLYAISRIDSSVSSSDYYPPISAITTPADLETWLAGSHSHKADWVSYNAYASSRYPDDAIRPQHCAILVSGDEGETWSILKKLYIGSDGAKGFITMGRFRNGECVCGFVDESGNFVKPVVITEGKHNYGNSGLDLEGDIFVKLNSSSVVTQL